MKGIEYVSIDLQPAPHVGQFADLARLPFPSDSFGGIICIHVSGPLNALPADEHVFECVKPGGSAVGR